MITSAIGLPLDIAAEAVDGVDASGAVVVIDLQFLGLEAASIHRELTPLPVHFADL